MHGICNACRKGKESRLFLWLWSFVVFDRDWFGFRVWRWCHGRSVCHALICMYISCTHAVTCRLFSCTKVPVEEPAANLSTDAAPQPVERPQPVEPTASPASSSGCIIHENTIHASTHVCKSKWMQAPAFTHRHLWLQASWCILMHVCVLHFMHAHMLYILRYPAKRIAKHRKACKIFAVWRRRSESDTVEGACWAGRVTCQKACRQDWKWEGRKDREACGCQRADGRAGSQIACNGLPSWS